MPRRWCALDDDSPRARVSDDKSVAMRALRRAQCDGSPRRRAARPATSGGLHELAGETSAQQRGGLAHSKNSGELPKTRAALDPEQHFVERLEPVAQRFE